jgi:pyruvate, orthophosphate dikinase
MILAEDDAARDAALAELLDVQTEDYLGIFEAMDGLPVTVRLLDPPLHEFLDDPRELEIEIARAECAGASDAELSPKRKLLEQIDHMAEANPMLGLRGCRLGIIFLRSTRCRSVRSRGRPASSRRRARTRVRRS